MGGQVVISVAARHPELVMAVASLDSPSNIPGWQNRFHAPFDHLMTFDGPYREAVHAFLKAAYLPTDDPSRVGGLADRLAGIPDHVIVRAWQAMSAYNPTSTLRQMKCPLSLYRLRPARSRPGSATRTMSTGGDRQDSGCWASGHQGCAGPDQRHAQSFHPTRRGHRRRNDPHRRSLPIQLSLSLKDRPHMTERFTTSDGVRIAYHQVGEGDPAIIFIHGAYSNRGGFRLPGGVLLPQPPLRGGRPEGTRGQRQARSPLHHVPACR